jgi:membrane fusion protein, heavy metal efflux system
MTLLHIGRIRGRPPLALLACLVLAACSAGPASERATVAAPADTALLTAEMVQIGGLVVDSATDAPWRDSRAVPGRLLLDPAGTQPLGAIAEGRITRVLVRVGDRVRAGQVVVLVHSHEIITARAGVATATAALERAQSEARVAIARAERADRLHAAKALSLADLERARADRVDAEAMRATAAPQLDEAHGLYEHLVGDGPLPAGVDPHEVVIRSPIAGVVVSRDAQPGQVVLPGAPLVTVSRLSSLLLELSLPEEAMATVALGETVRFSTGGEPGRTFSAKVVRIAPTVDSVTRTIAVQAQVVDPGSTLRAEQFVRAEVIGRAGTRALSVPAEAIQALEGDTVVIAAESRDGQLLLRAKRVRVGRRTVERVEVLGGLQRGERVIARGAAIAKAEILKQRDGGA